MTIKYSINNFQGLEGLNQNKDTWNDLLSRCTNKSFHLQWDWHFGLSQHLLPDLIYYSIFQGNQCVAIIPLQKIQLALGWINWPALASPKHKHIGRVDALIDSTHINYGILEVLTKHLRESKNLKWDLLLFSPFTSKSNLYHLLSQQNDLVQPIASSFFTRGSNYTLSNKQLKNIRRLSKKATQELGQLTFDHIQNSEKISEAFEIFLKLESSGWKGITGVNTGIAASPPLKQFYQYITNSFSASGNVAINILKSSDVPIAAQYCVKSGSIWYILKIAYDESFQAYGPGGILLNYFIDFIKEHHAENEWEINLTTSPKWAERWHFEVETLYKAEIFNRSFGGIIFKGLNFLRNHMKKNKKS